MSLVAIGVLIFPQTIWEIVVFLGVFLLSYVFLRTASKNRRFSRNISETEQLFKDRYDKAPRLPGPYPWPIIGNILSLGKEPHISFTAMTKEFGPIFGIHIGTVPVLVLNNIKVIKEALARQKDIFSGRPHFASYKLVSLGIGAVFNDRVTLGDEWLKMKQKMVKHIHGYASSVENRNQVAKHIWQETVYMTKTLEEMCINSPTGYVDPEQVIRVSVGNAVCAMCFGRRYEVTDSQFVQLLSMNREFGVIIGAGSQVDVMPWIKIFPHYKKAANEFQALCRRMEKWVLDKVRKNTNTYQRNIERNLLDALTRGEIEELEKTSNGNASGNVDNSGKVNLKTLSALVNDIFGAGQDTLSSAFLFILHYMSRFPDIQSRLRKDIYKVVGTSRLPTLDDRKNLPYLEAVFHEIMRHSSFVAITIPHLCLRNTILCGYKIPEGTMVFVNQYSANRDDTIWKDPYEFNPDRFLRQFPNGDVAVDPTKINKYTIFSVGERRCPGDELSKIWMILSMAMILHQCEILPDPDNPPTDAICYGLTMKPKNLRIKLQKLQTL